jgi:hypothetical protein
MENAVQATRRIAARKHSFALCCPASALTELAHFDGREMRRMTYRELFKLKFGQSWEAFVKEIRNG